MMTTTIETGGVKVRPIRDNLLLGVGGPLDEVRLAGTRCRACAETSLGSVDVCPNCGSGDVTVLPLSNHGTIWSYTAARHRPPGNYRGPDPFEPFGIALVELPEGLRVVGRVDTDIDALAVDMPVEFTPAIRHDDDGGIVVTFTYQPTGEQLS